MTYALPKQELNTVMSRVLCLYGLLEGAVFEFLTSEMPNKKIEHTPIYTEK